MILISKILYNYIQKIFCMLSFFKYKNIFNSRISLDNTILSGQNRSNGRFRTDIENLIQLPSYKL